MLRRRWWIIIIVTLLLVATIYALFMQPSIQEWAGFHIAQVVTNLQTWLNPPQKVSFSSSTLAPLPPPVIGTMLPSPSPFPELTPVPSSFMISGGKYYDQHNRWNYCGPANLAMLLSYQGWKGTPDDIAFVVKPYLKDKNVMPAELADYAIQAGLGAIVRVGGDLLTLKRLIAAGFPVMVEKGPQFRDIQNNMTWMGHYQVLDGYDDARGIFNAQDSYIKPNYDQSYIKLIEEWRSFNYTYVVVFHENKRNDVLNLLGPDADVVDNTQRALKKAADETATLKGVDLFFAYYNYGTNLVTLHDYAGAATAYDTAFGLYDSLPEDIHIRPYRILWYETGPFFAYYYTGRYLDVIEKATKNSIEMVRDDLPALEESYYWRGLARIAIGDQQGGIKDFYTCLQYHKDFDPCVKALNDQGITP